MDAIGPPRQGPPTLRPRGLVLLAVLALSCDAAAPLEIQRMECGFGSTAPPRLSQTCLFQDIGARVVDLDALRTYAPKYPLWSDGLHKQRWVLLPKGGTIDASDLNEWVFPVGTVFFKEFSAPDGRSLETRMMKKIAGSGSAEDDWSFATYKWSEGRDDAFLSDGERDVLGTDHRIPTQEQCLECHRGRADRVLGFDLVQLSDGGGLIDRLKSDGILPSNVPSNYRVPGDPVARKALGYLHGNCAHCHNPDHSLAWPGWWVGMDLRIDVGKVLPQELPTWTTAVNVETFYDRKILWKYRIAAGHPESSAVHERMGAVEPCLRMPSLGSQKVDREGLSNVGAWIESLEGAPTPAKDLDRQARDVVDFFGDKLHVMLIDATGHDSRRAVHECPHLPPDYVRPEGAP